jgi:hypothetical protein
MMLFFRSSRPVTLYSRDLCESLYFNLILILFHEIHQSNLFSKSMNSLPLPGIILGVSIGILLCVIVSIVVCVVIYTCRRGYNSSSHEELIPLTQEIEMKNNLDTDLMNARLFLRSTTYNLDMP